MNTIHRNRLARLSATIFAAAGTTLATGSITGDSFAARIFEQGFQQDFGNGVAGSAGADLTMNNYLTSQIDWLSDNSFELDFFGGGAQDNLRFEITDLNFTSPSGLPRTITGVTEQNAEFGWTYNLSFTKSSITIVYPSLNEIQAGDGEIITFQVATQPAVGVNCDTFTVDISEGGQPRDSDSGVAGAPGRDIDMDAFVDCNIEWLDGNTFELDFFSSLNSTLNGLTFVLDDLDFQANEMLQSITAVTELESEFDQDYMLTFDDNTITIVFPLLDNFQAADGEIITFRVSTTGQNLTGDMNCDGAITVTDIGAFVLALTNPPAYAMQFPDCNINHADTNGDNAITVSDIGPFIMLITG